MKKIFLGIATVITSAGTISAQDCMSLFPNNKGAELVTQSYDAQNNLVSTSRYTVMESYDNSIRSTSNINFQMTDKTGNVIDQGQLETNCDDDNFRMKLVSKADSPAVIRMLASNTELVGNYLDYPNVFSSFPGDDMFSMEPGEFTVYSKEDKKDFVKVNIRNRQYEKSEKVNTPAGEFDASKISFMYDVYDNSNKETTTFKGVEWLSSGAGIVRSETYDKDNNLLNYTVLTTLKDN